MMDDRQRAIRRRQLCVPFSNLSVGDMALRGRLPTSTRLAIRAIGIARIEREIRPVGY
jgi:hypothetical protein